MANRKHSPSAEFEAEIRMLHERIAALGAKAGEYYESERDLAQLLELGSIAIWTTDEELHLRTCRGPYDVVLGSAAAPGKSLADLFERDDLRLAVARNALQGRETKASLSCGDRVFTLCTRPLLDSTGAVVGAFAAAIDNTEQHRQQQALANGEQRYRELFENANDLIFTHDAAGRLTGVNAAVERMLGYSVSEALSMRIHDLLAPESHDVLEARLASLQSERAAQTLEAVALARSGDRLFLEIALRMIQRHGAPVSVEGIARDVTQRRMLEDQVRQAQKMEAIGVLAGGIAHDFNNLLTGILGYAYLIQAEQNLDSKIADPVDIIVKSAERAAQLTTQLLGFARRSKDQNIPVDTHRTIQELAELLSRTIDKRIAVVAQLGARSPFVMGDPGQIYQLLLNLCLNARDAMPNGGTLTVATDVTESAVVITVSDTGQGIPPEIRDRIFEPFFTTKPPGKGTGMGLAMVYGIARNHSGKVHVESQVGAGTSFYVTLPVCAGAPSESGEQKVAERGAGRILVIDDEELVRQVLSRMLKGLGYEVVAEGDAARAIEYYRSHYRDVDAVIVDMTMPQLSGRDVYYALRSVNPDVRVVLSSGYSRHDSAAELVKETGIEFLQKPYQIEQLASVLRRALAGKQTLNSRRTAV